MNMDWKSLLFIRLLSSDMDDYKNLELELRVLAKTSIILKWEKHIITLKLSFHKEEHSNYNDFRRLDQVTESVIVL